ncbi:MAG TPA: class I SAM-dependent methyltransferase [Vicinamibacteria bacterium]|nr:class I SAM-dependent methyltransferase [Vicinamibacteria bacterium]
MLARCEATEDFFKLRCPECGASAFAAGYDVLCPTEGRRIEGADGVLPLLRSDRQYELRPFLEAYRTVRHEEGWGGPPDYYLGLPLHDTTGRHRAIWKLRARSYRILCAEIEARFGNASLRVLDLGAGNGWLSYRLARMGHFVLATDISLDPEDGLGALPRYAEDRRELRGLLTKARAEFEELPLEDAQFDIVVHVGSLHYARCLERAVHEARRVVRPGGLFLVADSPTYEEEAAGRRMVERRRTEHIARYGIDGIDHTTGFLVLGSFRSLLRLAGFRVEVRAPFEGGHRVARRLYCRVKGLPPPARFPVFVAERTP